MSAQQSNELQDFRTQYDQSKFELTKLEDGTAVLLSIESGKLVTLNEVATAIVGYIVTGDTAENLSRSDLLNYLASQYEVDRAVLVKDVENFIFEVNSIFS